MDLTDMWQWQQWIRELRCLSQKHPCFLPNPSKTPSLLPSSYGSSSLTVHEWDKVQDFNSPSACGLHSPRTLVVTCKLQPAWNLTGSSGSWSDLPMETRVNKCSSFFPGSTELLCAYQSLHSFFRSPVKNFRHSKMTDTHYCLLPSRLPNEHITMYFLGFSCTREKFQSEWRMHGSSI